MPAPDRSFISNKGTFLVLAVAFLGACSPPFFQPLNAPPSPVTPKSPAAVEVLTLSPGRPFVELGVINQGNSVADMDTIRGIAGSHGCDAVVIPKDPGGDVACLVYTGK